MAVSEQSKLFYDISAIKDIPILDVADRLGIHVQKRGKNYWCKVRDEKNPSVVLHPDRNSYYDFGNQAHGDVISFVQYARNLSNGAAIRYLGETFGLEPNMTQQQLLDRPLTNWEYSRIGLHGDMATKNFVFPIEEASMDELCEISQYYQMPLNKLSEKEPEVYRDLIQQTAVPFVDALRNSYYLDVWNHFHLVYAMGDNSINLFRSQKVRDRFREDTTALNRAERILFRACKNAGLEVPEPLQHDPVSVIRQLLHGNLTITLGNRNSATLCEQAQQAGCLVCEADLPFYSYFDDRLLSFPHAAQYRAGKVTVQYLSSDASSIDPILEDLRSIPNRSLEQKIALAQQKKLSQGPSKKEKPKNLEIH